MSKDEGGDRFQVKTHALRQILDLGSYNFLPVAPTVMSLVFLKSQCRELSKNVCFYPILTYSFRVMSMVILASAELSGELMQDIHQI